MMTGQCKKCGVRTNMLSLEALCPTCIGNQVADKLDMKDESLREYLIEQILENNEPDQILIDLLKVDLLDLAEQELNKATIQQLKDLV